MTRASHRETCGICHTDTHAAESCPRRGEPAVTHENARKWVAACCVSTPAHFKALNRYIDQQESALATLTRERDAALTLLQARDVLANEPDNVQWQEFQREAIAVLRHPISPLPTEREMRAKCGDGEQIRCAFCRGEWTLVNDKKFFVVRGDEACICEHCIGHVATILSEQRAAARDPLDQPVTVRALCELLDSARSDTFENFYADVLGGAWTLGEPAQQPPAGSGRKDGAR